MSQRPLKNLTQTRNEYINRYEGSSILIDFLDIIPVLRYGKLSHLGNECLTFEEVRNRIFNAAVIEFNEKLLEEFSRIFKIPKGYILTS